ncbi:MAG: hypothetical protein A4E49_02935 [Methanosaeta sp. PtaU1.Bin112]|nr:MAG: hypothetical protein A4E49_02935 [Methanosaeta sp. PtaU1.Bin112]
MTTMLCNHSIIQEKDRRAFEQSAGNGDPLPLAAAEADAALAYDCTVALGKRRNENSAVTLVIIFLT